MLLKLSLFCLSVKAIGANLSILFEKSSGNLNNILNDN